MTNLLQSNLIDLESISGKPLSLAAFDMDETLVQGDCAQYWLEFLVSEGWRDAEPVLEECRQLMNDYDDGDMDMAQYMSAWLEPLVGLKVSELTPLLQKFVEQWVMPLVFKQAQEQLAEHRGLKHRLLVISASPDLIVRPIAERLGISDCIAIEVETSMGIITGSCVQPMSYREGKVTQLNRWLQRHNYPSIRESVSYFYSDSHNDLPLMEQVTNPIATNPDDQLLTVARSQSWQVKRWCEVVGSP